MSFVVGRFIWVCLGKKRWEIRSRNDQAKTEANYYGALDYGNKEFLVQPYKKGDSANTISLLKYLIKQRQNSRLKIIWDGAIYHNSQEVREDLELVNKAKFPEKWQIIPFP